eukprot:m.312823 g.312823  ORF g.312823 m.312823 type:complete len:371 (-) comp19661_c2_seq5:2097-3209(-)
MAEKATADYGHRHRMSVPASIVWIVLFLAIFPWVVAATVAGHLIRVLRSVLGSEDEHVPRPTELTTSVHVKALHPKARREFTTLTGHDDITELFWVGYPDAAQEVTQLYIVIPGNPGNTAFYEEYLEAVHEQTKIPCVAVGHLGHSIPSGKGHKVYSLDDNLAHKRAVVNHFLKIYPKARIAMAGHSVGAYMCVDVLAHNPSKRLLKIFCLMPTLHHIGSTPNGARLYPLLKLFRGIGSSLAFLLRQLPHWFRDFLINWHLPFATPRSRAAVHHIIHEKVALNSLGMGRHEMDEILHFDPDLLRRMSKKLLFCFAETDGWLTRVHEQEILECCPDSEVVRCAEGVRHGFVLDAADVVADLTVEWLRHLFH